MLRLPAKVTNTTITMVVILSAAESSLQIKTTYTVLLQPHQSLLMNQSFTHVDPWNKSWGPPDDFSGR